MAGSDTSAHYERLAGSYDENWAYSDTFLTWMVREIALALSAAPDDRIADIGCGTGLYTPASLSEHARRLPRPTRSGRRRPALWPSVYPARAERTREVVHRTRDRHYRLRPRQGPVHSDTAGHSGVSRSGQSAVGGVVEHLAAPPLADRRSAASRLPMCRALPGATASSAVCVPVRDDPRGGEPSTGGLNAYPGPRDRILGRRSRRVGASSRGLP